VAGVRPNPWGRRPPAVVIIAVEKAVSAVAVATGGVLALILHHRVRVRPPHRLFSEALSGGERRLVIRWLAAHLPPLGPRLTLVIAAVLLLWAVLLAAEAIGLWFDLGWGELLILVETAALLPVEVWEIVRRPHLTGFGALAINLLILGYVAGLYRRRLLQRAAGASLARAALGAVPAVASSPAATRASASKEGTRAVARDDER